MINKKISKRDRHYFAFLSVRHIYSVYTVHCFYSSQVSKCNQHTKPMFFYISQKGLNGLKPVNDEGAQLSG